MIKSYSKLNLFLRVLKKLKNGMHSIQTNSVLIDLHDNISVLNTNQNKDTVELLGRFTQDIDKKDNTIIKTLKILRRHNLIAKNKYFIITIKKNIPVFAGLGGGTGNAFYLAKYLLKKKFNKKIVKILEKGVGSDIKLFNYKQSFQKNYYKIESRKKKYNFFFVLVYPQIKSSTKEIYSKVRKFKPHKIISIHNRLNSKNYIEFLKKEVNDLQKLVEKKHKLIKNILKIINSQKGCRFSRMTGSGSTCYGLFSNNKLAVKALRNIKKKLPKYWCVVTKTI
jgi:4-diphosphocytidyl-2-C-methyl-D-erythritol kinase